MLSGGNATAPADPTKNTGDGVQWFFTGWDKPFSNITQTTIVTALYTDAYDMNVYNASGSTLVLTEKCPPGQAFVMADQSAFITGSHDKVLGVSLTPNGTLIRGPFVPTGPTNLYVIVQTNAIPTNYALATDADFTWNASSDLSAYTHPSETGRGFYSYSGSRGYIIVPPKIKGHPVTNYYRMFEYYNWNGTAPVGVANQVSNVTNLLKGFHQASRDANFILDLTYLNTSSVTTMQEIFRVCKATLIGLKTWDTSNVTSLYYAFWQYNAFKGGKLIDITGWDTSRVTNWLGAFGREAMISNIVGIENLSLASAENMTFLFSGSLSTIPTDKLTMWAPTNAYAYGGMFQQSKSRYYDLMNFDFTKNSPTLSNMFQNNTSAKIVYVGSVGSKTAILNSSNFPVATATVMVKTTTTNHYDLTGPELNTLMTDLPVWTSGARNINFSQCAGVADCSPSIATDKGWTVITA